MITNEGRIAAHSVVTNQHAINFIDVMLVKAIAAGTDETRTLGDLTLATFTGSSPLTDPAWDAATINGSGQAQGRSELLTWTCGSSGGLPETIIALAIRWTMDDDSEILFWFKRLPASVTIGASGEQIQRYIDLYADDIAALD